MTEKISEVEAERVKSLQFTFLAFLWKEISAIREQERKGEYYTALVWALDLVNYLPDFFQNACEFKKEAEAIRADLVRISRGARADGLDWLHTRSTMRARLQAYSQMKLKEFMSKLAVKMDARNYMEEKSTAISEKHFDKLDKK
jgi:hypothetical protein